jgi:hypothetical protein
MRAEDCNLNPNAVLMRPLRPNAPEREWVESREHSRIPESLFRFYCLAEYFGLDRSPRYLADNERILFSFLKGMVDGIRDSLDEAEALLTDIRADEGKGYSPAKEARREEWDREADTRQRRNFRNLVVALAGALDQKAEVVALLLPGQIPGLAAGRASFEKIAAAVETLRRSPPLVISPQAARREELIRAIEIDLRVDGTAAEWFELFRLYRNKLAHLGSGAFQTIALHDHGGTIFSFTPRRWPLFHQSEVRVGGTEGSIAEYVKENYIDQDMVSYAHGLHARVVQLIGRSFAVLCAAYNEFKEFELNTSALESLRENARRYSFRSF